MAGNKPGLGRGLDALFGDAAPPPSGPAELPIDSISPNPYQPRTAFDDAEIASLAASIREHGIVQPIVVCRDGDGYALIAGERRWRAARVAGYESIPAVIRQGDNQSRLEVALVENVQRADLNPLEEAAAYRRLVDEFEMTQEEVARRMGKSRAAVANSLRLLSLPSGLKQDLADGRLTEGHARALLGLPSEDAMLQVGRRVVDQSLNVRQTEALARDWGDGPKPRKQPAKLDPESAALEARIREVLGTQVRLERGPNGGKLTIFFHSEEELDGLYTILTARNESGNGWR